MNFSRMINRFVRNAELDAAADERAEHASDLHEAGQAVILIRRLPGAISWDLLVDGEKIVSGPNLDLDSVIDAIRRAGNRAVVEYDDQDSITARLLRKQNGQEVVSNLTRGQCVWIRRDDAGRYVPGDAGPTDARIDIQSISYDPATARYSLHSGAVIVDGLDPHVIVTLAERLP